MMGKTNTGGLTSNQLQLEEKLLVLPELTITDGLQIGEVAKSIVSDMSVLINSSDKLALIS